MTSENLNHVGGKGYWEVNNSDADDLGGERYLSPPRQGAQHGFARFCTGKVGVIRVVERH